MTLLQRNKARAALYAAETSATSATRRIVIGPYINDAGIDASDMPHTVVEKLQAAIDKANPPDRGSQDHHG